MAHHRTARLLARAFGAPSLLLATVLLFAGCENTPDDLVPGDDISVPGDFVSLSEDVQPIFDLNCAFGGCHAGTPLAENLSLEAGRIFDPQLGLVGVPSVQAPRLRVRPGSAVESYLINKLEGTQATVGGSGLQMPQFGIPLSDTAVQLIKDWIDEGAQDN